MSTRPTLLQRLRRARIVQVLAVYLGASWLVVQVADVLVERLELPAWVVPVAIILLMVGLVVILATAWVQSLPATTAREEAGELPTDWQIAPRDAWSSLRRGQLPHLTWGRALLGGGVALALLFGGAGTYVGLRGGGVQLGAAPASADMVAEGIAVVPFEVRGRDLEIWREGMMDLLTGGLDGVGGFRTIDSRTVMARWREHVGAADARDRASTLRVARATGARFAIEGSVIALGPDVRLATTVYDVDSGRDIATSRVEGPAANVLRLVDELTIGTMRSLLLALGRGSADDRLAETITTSSLPALRAFLEGERHYRRGRFAEAAQNYEQAVAEDSMFAIALVRLAEAYGWMESHDAEQVRQAGVRAMAQAHRLSPRYQFIMQGWDALNSDSPEGLVPLEEAVRRYPDDPTAWFLLAEMYIHLGGATYGTDDDAWEALQRATSLDPDFAPYLIHVAELAVLRGDRALAEQTVARYEALTGRRETMAHVELAIGLLLGTDDEVAAALDRGAGMPDRDIFNYYGTFARRHDRFDRDAMLNAAVGRARGENRATMQAYYAAARGHVARGRALIADPAVSRAGATVFHAYAHVIWGVQPAGPIDLEACADPEPAPACYLWGSAALARLGRGAEVDRSAARLRELAAALAEDEPARGQMLQDIAEVMVGTAAWRRGNVRQGRELLQRHALAVGQVGIRARHELASLEAEAGRPAEALRQFRSVLVEFTRPAALYGMATMHEQLGQHDQALPYWVSLATLTDGGDDLPAIRQARETVARAAREPAGNRTAARTPPGPGGPGSRPRRRARPLSRS
jgi:tetratricopeptide (TPR) repeat protein